MQELIISGYTGSKEELEKNLALGVIIKSIEVMPDEAGIKVAFEQKKLGRKRIFNKEEIIRLKATGMTFEAVAKEIGCTKAYTMQVCRENTK